MNETHTVRALLDFEDSRDELLFERVPGTEALLWPLARWPIARALSAENLKVVPIPKRRPSRLRYIGQQLRRALPNSASSDRLRAPIEYLFIASGTTRSVAAGGYGNWLTDAFAKALGDTAAVIQDAPIDPFSPPAARPGNPRTWTFAPALDRITRAAKFAPMPEASAQQLSTVIQRMVDPFTALLSEELREQVVGQITRRAQRTAHADREFTALLERTRPRRIYMQTAAYGDRSSFIRIAHERGIEVSELQHGWIGASHSAYNFGDVMTDPRLSTSLPDTLLSFGEYWAEHLRFPGRIVPIGKPALEDAARSAVPYADREPRLLLVSSVYERDRLLAAGRAIRQALPPSWRVVLRPHPSESADAQTLFAEAIAAGVELDRESDVNVSISRSRAVVGMISTVLFEALPFDVHIGVIETDLAQHYSDSTVFPTRLTSEDTFRDYAQRIQNERPDGARTAERIWHPNPVEAFLAETGAGSP